MVKSTFGFLLYIYACVYYVIGEMLAFTIDPPSNTITFAGDWRPYCIVRYIKTFMRAYYVYTKRQERQNVCFEKSNFIYKYSPVYFDEPYFSPSDRQGYLVRRIR